MNPLSIPRGRPLAALLYKFKLQDYFPVPFDYITSANGTEWLNNKTINLNQFDAHRDKDSVKQLTNSCPKQSVEEDCDSKLPLSFCSQFV
jgi:hypothetical protein